jgi:hypothetical protein
VRLSEAASRVLGIEVSVRPRGTGYRLVADLDDPAEALALAQRLSSAATGD